MLILLVIFVPVSKFVTALFHRSDESNISSITLFLFRSKLVTSVITLTHNIGRVYKSNPMLM